VHTRRLITALGSAAAAIVAASLFAPSPAPAGMAANTYKVDKAHSSVIFRIKHMNVNYFQGRFDDITGTFSLDDQNPSASNFDLKITSDSVDTAIPKRDQHIKSPDFLNSRQFPTITFKSKSVTKSGNDTFDVEGDLTLHGVTKPVTVKVERTGTAQGGPGGSRVGIEAIFNIKRSEFGMTNMLQALGDDVRLTINIEATGS
jgi:polyisoprenoid-binding protein YceI